MIKNYTQALNGGGNHTTENNIIIENADKIIKKHEELIESLKLELQEANEKLEKKDKTKRSLKDFNIRNLYAQYNKELDEINLILDDPQTIYDLIEIDEMMNDNKAGFKLQKHQKDFVKNWSLSSQEVTICYYGVGSGKTIIMILCAEQYLSINSDSYVYFCVPSSLVLNVIREMRY